MSKSNASVDISDGIEYENPIPQMIPVTIDAEPNIPAMDAYSGSTHLKVYHEINMNKRKTYPGKCGQILKLDSE